jgi:hypothetical protein
MPNIKLIQGYPEYRRDNKISILFIRQFTTYIADIKDNGI